MRKKLILAAVLAVSAVFCSLTALADDITVEVNGTKIISDVPAMVINDRTVVPVRAVSECAGCTVDWDGASNTVIITSGSSASSGGSSSGGGGVEAMN